MSANKYSTLKFIFLATIFSLVLMACGPQTPTEQPTSIPATSTAQPVSNTPGPVEATAVPSNTLVTLSAGQAAPGLALSWTISQDGLDYVFSLKTGATFSDGTPVNADAVLANFNRWFDPSNPAHGKGTYDAWLAAFGGFKGEKDSTGKPKGSFDGIEKVDEFTVLVHLNRPFSDLLVTLAKPDFSIENPATFPK